MLESKFLLLKRYDMTARRELACRQTVLKSVTNKIVADSRRGESPFT